MLLGRLALFCLALSYLASAGWFSDALEHAWKDAILDVVHVGSLEYVLNVELDDEEDKSKKRERHEIEQSLVPGKVLPCHDVDQHDEG